MPPRTQHRLNIHAFVHAIGCQHQNNNIIEVRISIGPESIPPGQATNVANISYFSQGQPTVLVDLLVTFHVHICQPEAAAQPASTA